MAQRSILNKMALYLQHRLLAQWQEPAPDQEQLSRLEQLICRMKTKGFCHGFTVCYAAMHWADTHSKQPKPANLSRWQTMLRLIQQWDGNPENLTAKFSLPLQRSKRAEEETEQVPLAAIFEEAISLVADHQYKQSISLGSDAPQHERLELSMPLPDGKIHATDGTIYTTQIHHKAAGQLTKKRLELLCKILKSNPHNLYFVNNRNHICCFWFESASNTFYYYDSNYENDEAREFTTTSELYTAIAQTLGEYVNFDILALEDMTLKPTHTPSEIHNWLEQSAEDLLIMATRTPEQIPIFFPALASIRSAAAKAAIKSIDLTSSNGDRINALLFTARSGQVAAVKTLLDAGASPHYQDREGHTALHYYAYSTSQSYMKSHTAVAALTQAGIDIETPNRHGKTALHLAAQTNNIFCSQALITAKAKINCGDRNRHTPLHLAAKLGHTAIVAELLKQGANVQAKSKMGATALHFAAAGGYIEIINLLLAAKANPNTADRNNRTPLMQAISQQQFVAGSLLTAAGAAASDSKTILQPILSKLSKTDQLLSAAKQGNIQLVNTLLAAGVKINCRDSNGNTPLLLAAQNGHQSTVRALLSAKADITAKNKQREGALFIAAHNNFSAMMAMLIQHDADCSEAVEGIASHSNNTAALEKLIAMSAKPLHISRAIFTAVKAGNKFMLEAFIRLFPDLLHKKMAGENLLHVAARGGDPDIIAMLLRHGIDPEAENYDGRTPLYYALEYGHLTAQRFLAAHCKTKSLKIIQQQLASKKVPTKIAAAHHNGDNSLHYAAAAGDEKQVTKLLKDSGRLAQLCNYDGRLPLHLAAANGHVAIIEHLCEHQQLDARDDNQQTALHLAAANGHVVAVLKLIALGAHPHAINRYGYSPWDYAVQRGRTEVLRAGLQHQLIDVYRLFTAAITANRLGITVAGFSLLNFNYAPLLIKALNKNDELFIKALFAIGVTPEEMIKQVWAERDKTTLQKLSACIPEIHTYLLSKAKKREIFALEILGEPVVIPPLPKTAGLFSYFFKNFSVSSDLTPSSSTRPTTTSLSQPTIR